MPHTTDASDERYLRCLSDLNLLVQKTSAVMQSLEREQMRRFGYTPTQSFLLSELLSAGSGGIRMGDLALRMSLEKSTLTRICDVLEKRGVIARAPDAEDRRAVCAVLTSAGRKTAQELREERASYVTGILGKLPKGHVREVMTAFETVLDAFRK